MTIHFKAGMSIDNIFQRKFVVLKIFQLLLIVFCDAVGVLECAVGQQFQAPLKVLLNLLPVELPLGIIYEE